MKYRLLKELPGYAVGTIFQKKGGYWNFQLADGAWANCDTLSALLDYSVTTDYWFEKMTTRWRANRNQNSSTFFVLDSLMEVEEVPATDEFEQLLYDSGNYFQSSRKAEAAADAIKALLQYVHLPIEGLQNECKPKPFPEYQNPNSFIRKADEARIKVQANG